MSEYKCPKCGFVTCVPCKCHCLTPQGTWIIIEEEEEEI
jgi:hypothetical protein